MENIIDDNDYYFRLKGQCQNCKHQAHCGQSCLDESCDYCTECACVSCIIESEK